MKNVNVSMKREDTNSVNVAGCGGDSKSQNTRHNNRNTSNEPPE